MLQEGIGDSRERGSGVSADLSPAAREELLRALHTSSSSVVAATYSVHIQTKERRQLAAFLQGKTKTIDEEEEERPVSMVQQSVSKQKQAAAAAAAAAAAGAAGTRNYTRHRRRQNKIDGDTVGQEETERDRKRRQKETEGDTIRAE